LLRYWLRAQAARFLPSSSHATGIQAQARDLARLGAR
jgi:hypothetical protein